MRTEVKSSLLKSVSYDRATRVLTVEFKPREGEQSGKVYEYADVDILTYEKFINAPSIGRAFLNEIKPAHSCKRVKEEEHATEKSEANETSGKTSKKKPRETAPDGDELLS